MTDSTASRASSADRLRERLSQSAEPLRLYQTEVLYHVQIDYTCQLLDVVDEVTDPVTAGMITDLIYERLTGDAASAAAKRAECERLMRTSVRVNPFGH